MWIYVEPLTYSLTLRKTGIMAYDILILGRKTHPDGKETATEIFEGLKSHFSGVDDYSLYIAYYDDLLFDIAPGDIRIVDTCNHRDLSNYNAVLMTNWFSHASIRKDIAYTLGLFFTAHNIAFFNTESAHSRSTSKLSQMMLGALSGVSVPRTVFSLSYSTLSRALSQPEHALSLPFILKDAQASRGSGNYLLKGLAELSEHKHEHNERSAFMAQSFVLSDHSDFRLFIIGGKVQFIIRRKGSEDSHLHNTSQGASTKILYPNDVSKEVIAMAEKMSSTLKREVTGLDVIFDKKTGQAFFLEANPIPQIATGSNIELKLKALADGLKYAAKEKNFL